MVRTKEELLSAIKGKIGDDVSDEAIALIEDVTDTIADMETKAQNTTNWEKKLKENDDAWRARYKERFFNPDPPKKEEDFLEEKEQKILSYEALFS